MLNKCRKAYQFPIPNSQFGNLKAVWQYAQQRTQAVQSHVT
ncbi:hypothetical protein QUA43_14015 [Microcoleus sp. N9_B4]